jgi:uncharacterized protein (DUF433 family)
MGMLVMSTIAERITVNPEQCGGRPCVRGLRIRVSDVLDLLASGLSPHRVLKELPDLEPDDISACLRFASRRLNQGILREEEDRLTIEPRASLLALLARLPALDEELPPVLKVPVDPVDL